MQAPLDKRMRNLLRNPIVRLARAIGSPIKDANTGRVIGRALLVPWRGKIHVIGLDFAVRPIFLPQKRLTYWKQELGFVARPPVDFPNMRNEESTDSTRP